MNCQVLSKGIAVPNLDASRLVSVMEVLWPLANDGVAVDLIVFAHREGADQVSPGADHAPGPQSDLSFNDGKRPHGNVRSEFRLRGKERCGVDSVWGQFHFQP